MTTRTPFRSVRWKEPPIKAKRLGLKRKMFEDIKLCFVSYASDSILEC